MFFHTKKELKPILIIQLYRRINYTMNDNTIAKNSKKEFNEEDYDFLAKTVQGNAFKSLFETLKEIITDVNLEMDSSGIKIIAMDTNHVALVHMKLCSNKFEQFCCPKPIICGISMTRFFKLLKIISPSDTLVLYKEKDDPNIMLSIETPDKNTCTVFKMKLMELLIDKVEVPPVEFQSVIRMQSSDFRKLCHDMNQLSDEIEITSCSNELRFGIENEWVKQNTSVKEGTSDGGLEYLQNLFPDEVIQGVFSLKYLTLFTKCTSLCPHIEIFLKNDYPIIIKYSVANIGEVKFCLAPKEKHDD